MVNKASKALVTFNNFFMRYMSSIYVASLFYISINSFTPDLHFTKVFVFPGKIFL